MINNQKKQLQNLNIKNEILNTKETIEIWLKQVNIENYTINDDMTVDCSSSVDISCLGLKKLPIQFGNIKVTLFVLIMN